MLEGCYLVLLRSGQFTIIECPRHEVFEQAQRLEGGICGVFENREGAEAFVSREQRVWT